MVGALSSSDSAEAQHCHNRTATSVVGLTPRPARRHVSAHNLHAGCGSISSECAAQPNPTRETVNSFVSGPVRGTALFSCRAPSGTAISYDPDSLHWGALSLICCQSRKIPTTAQPLAQPSPRIQSRANHTTQGVSASPHGCQSGGKAAAMRAAGRQRSPSRTETCGAAEAVGSHLPARRRCPGGHRRWQAAAGRRHRRTRRSRGASGTSRSLRAAPRRRPAGQPPRPPLAWPWGFPLHRPRFPAAPRSASVASGRTICSEDEPAQD